MGMTPEELKFANEKNYHGLVTAVFADPDTPDPSPQDVIAAIERRFGVVNPLEKQLTTAEVLEMLRSNLDAILPHLQRADLVSTSWFYDRISYLLQCASQRQRPQT